MKKLVLKSVVSKYGFIVLAGNFDGHVKENINIVKKKYIDPAFESFNYTEFFGDEFNKDSFSSAILSMPVMSDKKLIILKNAYYLKKEDCEYINSLCENLDKSIILIIIFASSMQTYSENIKKASLISNAYMIKIYKDEKTNIQDLADFINEKNINIPNAIINKILELTNNDFELTKNILNASWMINDENIFENILDNNLISENSPIMYFSFMNAFIAKNKQKSFDLYRKIIKWKILSYDALTSLLLKEVEKNIEIKQAYSQQGKEGIKKFINKKRAFNEQMFNKLLYEKIEICKKWNNKEIISLYNDLYKLLRVIRTIKSNFVPIYFEQLLIKYQI